MVDGERGHTMTTIQVTLTDGQNAFIAQQVAAEGHDSASEYVLSLLREAQRKRGWAIAENLILNGLESPAREMRAEDWEQLRRKVADAAQPEPT